MPKPVLYMTSAASAHEQEEFEERVAEHMAKGGGVPCLHQVRVRRPDAGIGQVG